MKALSAYNAGSERVLSPRLLVVDAAREPIKALKALTQGLASQTRNGIWLVNFQGVPAARAASEFDLVYLDKEHRVLQGIEISQDTELESITGHPASVLILPTKTIARSRTFTGDRIRIESSEHRSIPDESLSSSTPAVHLAPPMVPEFIAESSGIPSDIRQDAQSTAAVVSGSLRPSGKRARDRSSTVGPANPPIAAQSTVISHNVSGRKVVPIAGVYASLSDVERSATGNAPTPKLASSATSAVQTAADPSPGAPRMIAPIPSDYTTYMPDGTPATAQIEPEPKRTIAPVPRELTPSVAAPVIADLPSKIEQPLVTHSFPASKVASLEQGSIGNQSKIPPKTDTSGGPDLEGGDELERLSKKILSWLYPDAKSRRRIRRRAPRVNAPGLVGYYFAGGPSTPHEIKNISVRGFYMVMNQRWMPGTVLRVTLQVAESDGEDPLDSITVLSRVVRWGPDGGGFEFVFPGLID